MKQIELMLDFLDLKLSVFIRTSSLDKLTYSLSINAMTSFPGTILDAIKESSFSSLAFLNSKFVFIKSLLSITEQSRVSPYQKLTYLLKFPSHYFPKIEWGDKSLKDSLIISTERKTCCYFVNNFPMAYRAS